MKPPRTRRSSVSRCTPRRRRNPRSASSARTYQAPPKSARWRAAQTAGAGAGTLTAWRITTSYAGRYSSASARSITGSPRTLVACGSSAVLRLALPHRLALHDAARPELGDPRGAQTERAVHALVVLAQPRREGERRRIADRRRRQRDRHAGLRIADAHEAGGDQRIRHHLRQRRDARDGNVGATQQRQRLLARQPPEALAERPVQPGGDRKSTRLNS